MYRSLGPVTLKTGETVEAGVVRGPDPEWADRVCGLLGHKWQPWDWQNEQVLRHDLGIEVHFYLLHRGGVPFSNIMTAELAGVGIFGHVFTRPEDRRKHATSLLMALQMADFRERDGLALFLGTGYDSPAYHIYAAHGFRAIEPGSGIMDWYAESGEAFRSAWFAGGPAVVEPVGWKHWPASAPLFVADWPEGGTVRAAGPRLIGRSLTEEPLVHLIRRESRRAEALAAGEEASAEPSATRVLREKRTGAVAGLATWAWDPTWPGVCVVDVYCHPNRWREAPDLLASLPLPAEAKRVVAYTDAGCPAKVRLLESGGFRPAATLPRWAAVDAAKSRFADLMVYERRDPALTPSPLGRGLG